MPAASSPRRSNAGCRSRAGADLVRIAATEVEAQALEADANVAQIRGAARAAGRQRTSTSTACRTWPAPRRRTTWRRPTSRARGCSSNSKLVSQAEFELRQAQVETTRRQYETARNGALQQHQALAAARARATLARKARRRHGRARALRRRRRRTAGLGRRLRHPRHEGRVGDAHQPAAGRADGSGTAHGGRRRRPRRVASRSTPIPGRPSPARCAMSPRTCARTRARWSSKRWSRTRTAR